MKISLRRLSLRIRDINYEKKKSNAISRLENGFARDINERSRLETMTYSVALKFDTKVFNQHG